jgi:hypothetical protein
MFKSLNKVGLAFLLFSVLFLACDKNEEGTFTDIFEVTTAGIDINCALVLINFKESDLARIEKITNSDNLNYQAYNLDKNQYSEEGLILMVKVRKTVDSELLPCRALGLTHEWITVVDAKLKE